METSFQEMEEEFMENAGHEYETFMSDMLKKTPQEIYDNAPVIYFYKNVHEYLQENENVSMQFITLMHHRKDIISELSCVYKKLEHTSARSWEDIDGIVSAYLEYTDRLF